MASSGTALAPSVERDMVYNRRSFSVAMPSWYVFFFFSGFPALVYQIVWERALFTLYGVNIESVTMVVTAFLLGLGVGSLIGGWVSKHPDWPLLTIFGCTELLIAGYGVASLKVFHWAANVTAGSPPLETGVVAFALVVIPTVLMGSTLPILVSYTVRISHNVGTSVGALYAVNTLGSSAACFCAGLFLMRWLGQAKSILLVAIMNALIGGGILLWQRATREQDLPGENKTGEKPFEEKSGDYAANSVQEGVKAESCLSLPAAVATAAVAGFIALGYEIVWYRLFSFTTAGVAKSFAFLLGAYLAGIAVGALAAARVCENISSPRTYMRAMVACVLGANLIGFLAAPALFQLVVHVSYLWTLVPIGIAAGCLGAVFPLVCHISISANEQAGRSVSFIYLANIVGSALGSYLTGFVLMDMLPLRQVNVALALLGLCFGLALMLKAKFSTSQLLAGASAVFLCALFVIFMASPLFNAMYEKMMMKTRYAPGAEFAAVVETRSGVITVTPGGVVFGGGIYDGKFNVSLVNDGNGIQRAFALSYFCASPKEVLMIGLSSGSWAQVIANHPQVEHLTIVEINPGYLPLIQRRPEVASLLRNPKVQIYIDDGRRWLARNADRHFDAIIINTSFNWRSNTSNLLSTDFLRVIRQHLNAGGVHFYNTTESDEALSTGVNVFPYGLRVANFLAVSDAPLQLDPRRWFDVLTHYQIDGKPVFDLSRQRDQQRLMEVMRMATTLDQSAAQGFFTLESAPHIRARTRQARLITDDNMGTEWMQ